MDFLISICRFVKNLFLYFFYRFIVVAILILLIFFFEYITMLPADRLLNNDLFAPNHTKEEIKEDLDTLSEIQGHKGVVVIKREYDD